MGFARPRDEAGLFEHLQMAGDGGQADLERLGEITDGGLAQGEARQDRAPGRIGERRERRAERIERHSYLPYWLSN